MLNWHHYEDHFPLGADDSDRIPSPFPARLILARGRFLLSKYSDMQTFAGESMMAEGGMAFGYYKDGAHHPTFAYITIALEEEKVRTAHDPPSLQRSLKAK